MAVAVGGVGELEGNRDRPSGSKETRALVHQSSRPFPTDRRGQELEQGNPLVVPRQRSPGLVEQVALGHSVRAQPVDESVVRFDHRHLHLGNQEVHVLSRIADQRDALLVARQVLRKALVIEAEQQLGRIVAAEQVRIARRAIAVQALQVESSAADVAQHRLVIVVGDRRAIGGDVMGDELPEGRPSGRDRARFLPCGVHRVARPAGSTDRMQQGCIDGQVGEVGKHSRVAVVADRTLGRARRCQAVMTRWPRLCGRVRTGSAASRRCRSRRPRRRATSWIARCASLGCAAAMSARTRPARSTVPSSIGSMPNAARWTCRCSCIPRRPGSTGRRVIPT